VTERGSVAPFLVILLAAGVAALGLAVDLGRYAAAVREAAHAADVGAEAGAAVIDVEAAYAGALAVDPGPAAAVAADAAARSRPRDGRRIRVDADERRVCVTVDQRVPAGMLRVFGVPAWTVSAQGCAAPGSG
jgi:hypothetical protein